MLINAINNSFFLDNSQKNYLAEKAKNSDDKFKNKLLLKLNAENEFILQLLKKYKDDTNSTSIGQLKGEIMQKNFQRIKKLEESDNEETFDLDKSIDELI